MTGPIGAPVRARSLQTRATGQEVGRIPGSDYFAATCPLIRSYSARETTRFFTRSSVRS